LSCKRIASTSFHGLVIPETYGVPNVWFGPRAGGGGIVRIEGDSTSLDHRIRDFYAGAGASILPVFCQRRDKHTGWEALIDWIDRNWSPLDYNPTALFEAYPLAKAVSLNDPRWPLDPIVVDSIPF